MKILFSCLRVLRLADGNKVGMDKVFYYARNTKISIIKSSSDIDNKELFTVSESILSGSSVTIFSSSSVSLYDEIHTF